MIDPRYYYDDVDSLITDNNITDILFLYNVDTFMTDTSLADVLEPSAEEDSGQSLAEDLQNQEDGQTDSGTSQDAQAENSQTDSSDSEEAQTQDSQTDNGTSQDGQTTDAPSEDGADL